MRRTMGPEAEGHAAGGDGRRGRGGGLADGWLTSPLKPYLYAGSCWMVYHWKAWTSRALPVRPIPKEKARSKACCTSVPGRTKETPWELASLQGFKRKGGFKVGRSPFRKISA